MRWKVETVIGIIILIGVSLGGGYYLGGKTVAPVTVTVTETVTSPPLVLTPEVCTDALSSADVLVGDLENKSDVASQAIGLVPDVIDAVYAQDAGALNNINHKITGLSSEMSDINDAIAEHQATFDDNSAKCRAE